MFLDILRFARDVAMSSLHMHAMGWSLRGSVFAVLLVASTAVADEKINKDTEGVAILGYDTVAYFTDGRPVKGSPDFEYVWQDARWRFASAEHRTLFVSSPDRYAPQFGGFCTGGIGLDGWCRSTPTPGLSSTVDFIYTTIRGVATRPPPTRRPISPPPQSSGECWAKSLMRRRSMHRDVNHLLKLCCWPPRKCQLNTSSITDIFQLASRQRACVQLTRH